MANDQWQWLMTMTMAMAMANDKWQLTHKE
jgi:hypothetical protein